MEGRQILMCVGTIILYAVIVEGAAKQSVAVGVTSSRQMKDPVYSCPEGYTQSGKECSALVQSDPVETCPSDSVLTELGCRSSRHQVFSCPDGYYKDCPHHSSKRCTCVQALVQEQLRDPCPEGTTQSTKGDYCEQVVRAPIVDRCPSGYVDEWESKWKHGKAKNALSCVAEEYLSPDCECSKGERSEDGNTCVFEEVYDCTPGSFSRGHFNRLLAPKRAKKGQFSSGLHHGSADATKGGHFTKEVLSRMCRRTKITKPICRCPEGSKQIDNGHSHFGGARLRCVVRLHADAQQFCSTDGSLVTSSEQCNAISKISPTYSCADMFVIACRRSWIHGKQDCKCVRIGKVEMQGSCLEGYTLEDGECRKYSQADVRCPHGFDLIGDACEKIKTVPPTVTYTTTYSCVGKGCGALDNHHAKLKAHAKKLHSSSYSSRSH